MPDFTNCVREGPRPIVVRGRYSGQLNYAIAHLRSGLIGGGETVAFLYPMGGQWQEELRARLRAEGLPFVEITRESEWPDGDEQIALSTMYSAKGLEFDHVILLGYNAELVKHGPEEADARLENHRRLLAMALGRARTSVLLGYKPEDAAAIVQFLAPGTYEPIDV